MLPDSHLLLKYAKSNSRWLSHVQLDFTSTVSEDISTGELNGLSHINWFDQETEYEVPSSVKVPFGNGRNLSAPVRLVFQVLKACP